MLNIIIPMAGRGSRFLNEGYILPKPLIPIHGKPMIQLVINNLKPKCSHRFIFLCLHEHLQKYKIDEKLHEWVKDCTIVNVDSVTQGAACTVLLAKKYINNKTPLMIANSDQWVDININNYLKILHTKKLDGLIMTMWANDPKWSFIKFDINGHIIEVVEKQVVSNEATVGIYNYRHGSDFIEAAESMISKNLRVNNEFYIAPTYNEMINKGKRIGIYNIGRESNGMYGLGIPSDLKKFESFEVSSKAVHLK